MIEINRLQIQQRQQQEETQAMFRTLTDMLTKQAAGGVAADRYQTHFNAFALKRAFCFSNQ